MPTNLRLAPTPLPAPTRIQTTKEIAERAAIRIILADDHALMRRSLRLLLDTEPDLEVVAEADDLALVVRHVHGQRPHVLVLDLGMPGGSSVDAIRRLRTQVPETNVVVVAMEDNPVFAQQALDAGAVGFVLKDTADEDLPPAVRAAAKGKEYVSQAILSRLGGVRESLAADKLSPREVEVLRLIALGHTSVEIAEQLHLSPRTIETHRTRIHRKLGITSRSELVRYAFSRGMVQP